MSQITIKLPDGAAVRRGELFLTLEQAQSLRGKLSGAISGGRPETLQPCRWCKAPMGARKRREHEPYCPSRPTP